MALKERRLYYEKTGNRFVTTDTDPNLGRVYGAAKARMGDTYVWVFPATYPDGIKALADIKSLEGVDDLAPPAAIHAQYLQSVPELIASTTLVNSLGYTFTRKPYMHQLECMETMLHYDRVAILAEQGLGKTYIAACYIELMRLKLERPVRALVLAPKIVLRNWMEEISRYTKLSSVLYRGSAGERAAIRAQIAQDGQPDVVITNYDVVTPVAAQNRENKQLRKSELSEGDEVCLKGDTSKWLGITKIEKQGKRTLLTLEDTNTYPQTEVAKGRRPLHDPYNYMDDFYFINNLDYDIIIMDEGSRLKGHKSSRGKAVEKLAEKATYRAILSGTITLGTPLDVYQPFTILNHHIFGTNFYSFRSKYCIFSPHNKHQVTGYKNLAYLKELVDPYVVSKVKADCLDLPPRVEAYGFYELSPEQVELYNAIVTEEFIEVQGTTICVPTMITKINKLLQVMSGFIMLPRSRDDAPCNTCDYLENCMMEEIYPWNKSCRLQGTGLVEHLKRPTQEVRRIPSGTGKIDLLRGILEDNPQKTIIWARYRQEIADIQELLKQLNLPYIMADEDDCDLKFEQDDTYSIFLGQVSQGIGITLNTAKLMIYYSQSLNLEDRLQSSERNLRIGQNSSVTLIDIVCAGTIDTEVVELLRQKENIKSFIQTKASCSTCSYLEHCTKTGVRPYTEQCQYHADCLRAQKKYVLSIDTI